MSYSHRQSYGFRVQLLLPMPRRFVPLILVSIEALKKLVSGDYYVHLYRTHTKTPSCQAVVIKMEEDVKMPGKSVEYTSNSLNFYCLVYKTNYCWALERNFYAQINQRKDRII